MGDHGQAEEGTECNACAFLGDVSVGDRVHAVVGLAAEVEIFVIGTHGYSMIRWSGCLMLR